MHANLAINGNNTYTASIMQSKSEEQKEALENIGDSVFQNSTPGIDKTNTLGAQKQTEEVKDASSKDDGNIAFKEIAESFIDGLLAPAQKEDAPKEEEQTGFFESLGNAILQGFCEFLGDLITNKAQDLVDDVHAKAEEIEEAGQKAKENKEVS